MQITSVTIRRALVSLSMASVLLGSMGTVEASGPSDAPTAPTPGPGSPPAAVSATLEGIDVSHWQGTIDWTAVSAAGKRFAVIKATEATTFVDPQYVTNRAGAKAAGLRTTGYHFARPDTAAGDAVAEADHFVDVARIGGDDLIPALDLETTGGLGTTALQSWVAAWLGEVTARIGVHPMIYVSPNFWKTYMGDTTSFANAGYTTLWIAHWNVTAPSVPAQGWAGHGWTFWQYSNCGTVPGITGCVDLDRYNGTDLRPVLLPAGTTYQPITPARVLDTRSGVGLTGMFVANMARTWQVAGKGGVPANAVAVTGNVTVTQQQAAGYVSVTPTATNTPPASTINVPLGDNRANNLAVPLSATGTLSAVYKAGAGKRTHLIFDVTGYFLADDSGATFSAISPARILDTRSAVGLAGPFVSDTARRLQVTGGSIPSTAIAITGNLTVTQQTARGYLSVSPDPPAPLPATSNLNFPVNDNRANGLFAPLDGSGRLWIVYKSSAGATTHVILDVTGYFEPGTAGLRFVPLSPRGSWTPGAADCRRLSGPFTADIPRVLPVDGHWGVPLGTTAITGNLTVTQQTDRGYISVSPTAPPPVPATSTLNFPLGDNRANGLVTPLNGSGDTYLVYVGATGRTTHLILDLSGYFE